MDTKEDDSDGSGGQGSLRPQNQELITAFRVDRSSSGTVRILSNERVVLQRTETGSLMAVRLNAVTSEYPVLSHMDTKEDNSGGNGRQGSPRPQNQQLITKFKDVHQEEQILSPSLAEGLDIDDSGGSGIEMDTKEDESGGSGRQGSPRAQNQELITTFKDVHQEEQILSPSLAEGLDIDDSGGSGIEMDTKEDESGGSGRQGSPRAQNQELITTFKDVHQEEQILSPSLAEGLDIDDSGGSGIEMDTKEDESGGSGRQGSPRAQNQELITTFKDVHKEEQILSPSLAEALDIDDSGGIGIEMDTKEDESGGSGRQGSPRPQNQQLITTFEVDQQEKQILPPSLAEALAIDSGSEADDEEEELTAEQIQEILEFNSDNDEVEDDSAAFEVSDRLTWSDDFTTFRGSEETYTDQPGPSITSTTPFELFAAIWDRSFMEKIVQETNHYAWQTIVTISEADGFHSRSRLNEWVEVTVEEMYKFFSILMYMGICHRGRIEEYWSTGILGMPEFRKIMGINRFLLIMRFLHFVDNYDLDMNIHGHNRKTAKIEPVVQHCNEKFRQLYTPQRYLSLDESLLLWKGRLNWVQCIRSKAARFGIKTYELCEAETGYLLKLCIYSGKGTELPESIQGFTGATAKVVLRLMDGYLNKGHSVVMDNFYNSVALSIFLKQNRTDSLGTLNRRRVDTPADIKALDQRRMQRGDIVARHCTNVTVVAWKDVKLVTMISTQHNADTAPGQRAGVACDKPLVVHSYNKYMGGVDLKDQKLSMYLLERKRGLKWYVKVFRRLLNCSILNTYVMYRSNCAVQNHKLNHRQYRYLLADQLAKQHQSIQRIRPAAIEDASEVRMDGIAHFPDHMEIEARVNKSSSRFKRGRCVRCTIKKKRTEVSVICTKCRVFLCIGQCWREYHTLRAFN